MLCYELKYSCRYIEKAEGDKDNKDDKEERVKTFNRQLQAKSSDKNTGGIFRLDEEGFSVIITVDEPESCKKAEKEIAMLVSELMDVKDVECLNIREITVKEFNACLELGGDNGFLPGRRRFSSSLNLDFESRAFELDEEIADDEELSYEEAVKQAQSIMCDPSLMEELDRIYASENSDRFYGFPVHYHIKAGSREAALMIVRLIIKALHSRGRLPARRISIVKEISSSCFDESGMNNLIGSSALSAVVFDLKADCEESEFATEYERVVPYLSKLIIKNREDTLFFLIENTAEPGLSKSITERLLGEMDLMTINEGRGDIKEARAYLDKLVSGSRYAELADEQVYKKLEKKSSYLAADVHKSFDEWKRQCLRETAYSAYKSYKCHSIKKKYKKQKAYERLMGMTGLGAVKELTDKMLAFYRLKKMREGFRMDGNNICRHMVFTGNPGCAKTTAARLIAEILTEEHILDTGVFVECGRSDLVGKYVGWTAKIVRRKFLEARGGVLFIDEAYSLLDQSHSFGDEAINTIVQEMENMRDKVLVIFAGYPGPMEDLINRNEGLRSRIAFHVAFDDYDTEELTMILKYMCKEQGYILSEESVEKCRGIFYNAGKHKDFGNGRFVRNLLDKALLNQAVRLSGTSYKGRKTKKMLSTLIPEDFEEISVSDEREKISRIGFV